jgi:hypothetical protein
VKRWAPQVLRICVFLLLGAIVNVAVAWGFAVWSPMRLVVERSGRPAGAHEQGLWETRPSQAVAPKPTTVHEYAGFACEQRLIRGVRAGLGEFRTIQGHTAFYIGMDTRLDAATLVKSGFPCSAVSGERWDFDVGPTASLPYIQPGNTSVVRSPDALLFATDITLPDRLGGPSYRIMGWRPLWPGFAINTLFYAGILWLLFAAPFALRRRRRIKGGLCPACAYPVGESAICTECGKPVAINPNSE